MRYVPFPDARIVFRAGLYGMLGLLVFAFYQLGGPEFTWWIGLLLCYMSAQRLFISVGDQIADQAYSWYSTRTEKYIAWYAQVAELCGEKVPPPEDAPHLFTKGYTPEQAFKTAAARAKTLGVPA